MPMNWVTVAMVSYRKTSVISMVIMKGPSPLLLLQKIYTIDYLENK